MSVDGKKNMSLSFPPVSPKFIALFGEICNVIWENPCRGIFGIIVKPNENCTVDNKDTCRLLETARIPIVPTRGEYTFDVPHILQIPPAFPQQQTGEPPKCLHGQPSVRRCVSRKDSVNIGRYFFTCPASSSSRCGFFRWADELGNYTDVQLIGTPMTTEEVMRETSHVSREMQLRAWKGVQQGSNEWHNLRRVRITASNFGSVHNTNTYSTANDLLRNILWPCKSDSVAMKYGSVNEKVGIDCITLYLSRYGVNPDLPIYVDEPGPVSVP